jgi:hypothetical protein
MFKCTMYLCSPFLDTMDTFLEILKFTLPALIVFITAYFLLKQYLDDQYRQRQLALRNDALKLTLPMRLQAYERLTLLCDRIFIPNMLMRIRMQGMSVADLRGALMLAISQEFEHNISQQMYISETLWGIITLAKDEALSLVAQAAEGYDLNEPDHDMARRLLLVFDQPGYVDPLRKALVAIRTEAGRLF